VKNKEYTFVAVTFSGAEKPIIFESDKGIDEAWQVALSITISSGLLPGTQAIKMKDIIPLR
jgi:hypothetical protein